MNRLLDALCQTIRKRALLATAGFLAFIGTACDAGNFNIDPCTFDERDAYLTHTFADCAKECAKAFGGFCTAPQSITKTDPHGWSCIPRMLSSTQTLLELVPVEQRQSLSCVQVEAIAPSGL